jgi:hypothetical protein
VGLFRYSQWATGDPDYKPKQTHSKQAGQRLFMALYMLQLMGQQKSPNSYVDDRRDYVMP